MEWTVQDLGAIGEFIGGSLIIATLVYLAIQTRQTAKVGYWQMYTDTSNGMIPFFMELAKDAKLSELWAALNNPDFVDLSKDDMARSYSVFSAFLTHAETAFFMNTEFPESAKNNHERWIKTFSPMMACPLPRHIWKNTKHGRSPEFCAFLDSLISNSTPRGEGENVSS